MPDPSPRPHHVRPVRLSRLAVSVTALRCSAGTPEAALETPVTGISLDSRSVRGGDLYLARAGEHTHGIDHLPAAIAAGAAAVLTDARSAAAAEACGLPVLVADDPREVAGPVAALVYGHPSEALTLYGVTGTNGKTTTCWLLEAALRAAGRRTGLIGTVATLIDGEDVGSLRTTPEATDLQALLALMLERGVDSVAMEVSSHALSLGRVTGSRFDVAGFTNLSQDHLDFHGDMDRYFAAKAQLFAPALSRRAVVTVDDAGGRRMAAAATVDVATLRQVDRDDTATSSADWRWRDGGNGIRLTGPDVAVTIPVQLPGRFNRANAGLAAAMAMTAGQPAAAVADGIGRLGAVPGRMQPVVAGQPFTVIVDYAHTPDAVIRLVGEARALVGPGGRVSIVLGCGGDRDRAKRPLMGAAAATADRLLITDDNPRSEDPAAIRRAMRAGAEPSPAEVVEIGDRRQAIGAALAAAGPGDVVLIAGKGHERGQQVGDRNLPFDDLQVAAEQLRHLGAGTAEDSPLLSGGG